MGLFGRPNRVRRCSDTYSLTVEAKYRGIGDAVQSRGEKDDLLLVVSHFPETFFSVQEEFSRQSIQYDIVDEPSSPDRLRERIDFDGQSRVQLALASLLVAEEAARERDQRRESSIIVAERHPLQGNDDAILRFAQCLVSRTRLGYFIALKDPLVEPILGDWTEMVLRQMGMKDHELITSHMVTRRLDLGYRKLQRRIKEEVPADSQLDWIKRNASS